MNRSQTSYLARFDDLCPTMNWNVWREVEALLVRHDIKPILAVVPDNRDPNLDILPPAADFWHRVRVWQSRGWTIALHGYQHRYVNNHSGLMGRNRYSEFAGLSEAEQEAKIASGLEIFAREKVKADAWVAPAHSFDGTTLKVLARHGIRHISDGYALRPYRDEEGRVWAPQQIGRFRKMPPGVWTVCLHCNAWKSTCIQEFANDLQRFQGQFTTFERAIEEGSFRRPSLADAAFSHSFRMARRLKDFACA
jgi:predicted deacetylase